MISIVGGGGKTTTMYFLANKYKNQGKKVIITTSTHILEPENYNIVYYEEEIDLEKEIDDFFTDSSGDILVIGKSDKATGKLSAPPDKSFTIMKKKADVVLVEADGAKMLPIKVPRDNEPCIPAETDIFIVVAGIDALYKPAKDICFRYERAKALFSWKDDHLINEEDIANILSNENAGLKGSFGFEKIIILNKADTKELYSKAQNIKEKIENKLNRQGYTDYRVYITSNSNRDIEI